LLGDRRIARPVLHQLVTSGLLVHQTDAQVLTDLGAQRCAQRVYVLPAGLLDVDGGGGPPLSFASDVDAGPITITAAIVAAALANMVEPSSRSPGRLRHISPRPADPPAIVPSCNAAADNRRPKIGCRASLPSRKTGSLPRCFGRPNALFHLVVALLLDSGCGLVVARGHGAAHFCCRTAVQQANKV
jgi:hypothetical protein